MLISNSFWCFALLLPPFSLGSWTESKDLIDHSINAWWKDQIIVIDSLHPSMHYWQSINGWHRYRTRYQSQRSRANLRNHSPNICGRLTCFLTQSPTQLHNAITSPWSWLLFIGYPDLSDCATWWWSALYIRTFHDEICPPGINNTYSPKFVKKVKTNKYMKTEVHTYYKLTCCSTKITWMMNLTWEINLWVVIVVIPRPPAREQAVKLFYFEKTGSKIIRPLLIILIIY
jgi:hypothetical protein